MTNPELRKHLAGRYACKEAMEWLGDDRDSTRMWDECERPDWLLWYATNHVPLEQLVLAACDCAETSLFYLPEGENRPRIAIETARKWAVGEASLEDVKKAAKASLIYSVDDYRPRENPATYAAVLAYTPDIAKYAAAAAYFTWNLGYSANYGRLDETMAAAAKGESMFQLCKIIRRHWPTCPEAK